MCAVRCQLSVISRQLRVFLLTGNPQKKGVGIFVGWVERSETQQMVSVNSFRLSAIRAVDNIGVFFN